MDKPNHHNFSQKKVARYSYSKLKFSTNKMLFTKCYPLMKKELVNQKNNFQTRENSWTNTVVPQFLFQ